jgi:hypothetical protein
MKERGERGKKVRCDILEAFAMLGALAWQATVIKRCFLVSWGEIARGLVFLAPGSPSLCVPLCLLPLVAWSSRGNCCGTLFQRYRIKQGATAQTPKVPTDLNLLFIY